LVEKHCVGDGKNGGLLGQCSIEDFKQIYTLGSKLKSDDLMTPVREQWLKRLGSEPKDDPAFSSKGFLDFAEDLDDRGLQAQIYYFELLKMKPENCALVNPLLSNNFTPMDFALSQAFGRAFDFLLSNLRERTAHFRDINRLAHGIGRQCGIKEFQEILNAQCLTHLGLWNVSLISLTLMVVAVGYMGGICWVTSKITYIVTSWVLRMRFEGFKNRILNTIMAATRS